MPGVRMYLNNNTIGPVIIGSTGIYQLDLEGSYSGPITLSGLT
jgi:hypothetical protein